MARSVWWYVQKTGLYVGNKAVHDIVCENGDIA